MRGISTIAVVVGFALVGVSFFWAQAVGGRSAWSEENAKEFMAARAEEHRLKYEAAMAAEQTTQAAPTANPQSPLAEARLATAAESGTPVEPSGASADRLNAEYAAAKQRYEKVHAALENAKSQGEDAATTMRWIGFALTGAGLLGLITLRSDPKA